jgi:elongation factor Ts
MTAAISASLVKELREQTGAGMMDCKRALEETSGDIEAARRLLRERGMAQAGKRAGRVTTEGLVLGELTDDHVALVAVGCETEPVARAEEFEAFAEKVLATVLDDGAEAVSALEDERVELAAKVGENVVVRDAARFLIEPGEGGIYLHIPARKVGAIVRVRGASGELPRRLAMQIAAAAPHWVNREDVPEDVVAAERDIYANSDEVQSKPEQARDRIVEGMLNKRFFAAQVLVDQPWIHDTARTVGQVLADEGAEVLEFARFAVAE